MITFVFTEYARKQYFKLPPDIQERVHRKLQILKNHSDIFSVLKSIQEIPLATHRLRMGGYRLLLFFKSNQNKNITFLVVKIAHRREVYR